ncbi:MAG: hypothetical protein ACI85K_001854 [Hyphomicrobiaceae bacterium]|jgi:hypothetical protein
MSTDRPAMAKPYAMRFAALLVLFATVATSQEAARDRGFGRVTMRTAGCRWSRIGAEWASNRSLNYLHPFAACFGSRWWGLWTNTNSAACC